MFDTTFNKSSIARRFIIYIVLFSSFITLIITAFQLYRDYTNDIILIHADLEQIENVHLSSLSAALWASNSKLLQTNIEGILKIRDIQYVKIYDAEKDWAIAGEIKGDDNIQRSYSIDYHHRKRDVNIGKLIVNVSLEGVYKRLYNTVWVILISNAIKTSLVAIFIFFLFYHLVARHLIRISDFSKDHDPLYDNKSLLLDRSGSDNDEFEVVVKSINDMHARLHEQISEINQQKQYLSQTLNSIGDAVITTDEKGNVTRMNPIAEQLTAWSFKEAKGKPLKTIFSIMDASSHEPIENPVEKVISSGETIYLSNHTTLTAKDGTEYQIADSAAPIRDEEHILGMVLVFNDITEQYRLREEAELRKIELEKSKNELEEQVKLRTEEYLQAKQESENANQAKSEFLSLMSHELRTPLNAIMGFAQLLEMSDQDEESKDNTNEICIAGRHLLELINEILDLSKIETGNLEVSLEKSELNQYFHECLNLIEPLAMKRDINVIDKVTHDTSHYILADYTRFKQILVNLLSNAVKYNRDSGSITLSCETVSNNYLRISITDTGLGLNIEQQNKLFKPFERIGAEATEIEGTGIGLVITKRLIELMGGSIGVDSQPGIGSTFWVDIKLVEEKIQQPTKSNHTIEEDDRIKDEAYSSKVILYIEDNPANLKVVTRLIHNKTHYKLISAPDAKRGLMLAESQLPDLILMDINLPEMDGYKALEKLQANKDTQDISVIAVSANAMKRDLDKAKAAGFIHYVTKPFDLDELLNVINEVLHESS